MIEKKEIENKDAEHPQCLLNDQDIFRGQKKYFLVNI